MKKKLVAIGLMIIIGDVYAQSTPMQLQTISPQQINQALKLNNKGVPLKTITTENVIPPPKIKIITTDQIMPKLTMISNSQANNHVVHLSTIANPLAIDGKNQQSVKK